MGSATPPLDRIGAALRSLTDGYTIELTPTEAERIDTLRGLLAPGTGIYLTAIPGAPPRRMVEAAARIAAAGFHPIPHIAARSFPSLTAIDAFVAELVEAAAVTGVLVIAGSDPRPAGDVESSIQVLRAGILEQHGIRRVGVAGHPEGHPDIATGALAAAVIEKNELAATSGLDVYFVTQFCFAPEPYVRWEREIRLAGNRLPVCAGLPGVTSMRKLLRFGVSCGIGPSLRVLRKRARGLAGLVGSGTYRPDMLIRGIAEAMAADPSTLFESAHFYPFGGAEDTVRWLERLL